MSVPKIKGIETEWGAVVQSKDSYESADLFEFFPMINAIRKFFNLSLLSRLGFFRDIENIERITGGDRRFDLSSEKRLLRDASNDDRFLGEIWRDEYSTREERRYFLLDEIGSRGGFLPNGARFYIDGPHIEYSTPECLSAKTLVAVDKVGEIITNLARIAANKVLKSSGKEIIIYKDTSDRKENSYACHENYFVSRKLFEDLTRINLSQKAEQWISYLVARQIFTGSGGIAAKDGKNDKTFYQISQRADFITRVASDDTIVRRGIINLRDEPHSDRSRFARLHVIVGDANLSEISTYLKVGITSIILEMLENGFLKGDLTLSKPLEAIRLVSRDLSVKKAVIVTGGGKRISGLDLNWMFFENAKDYFASYREPNSEEKDLLLKWEEILNDFSSGNETRLRRRLDWKIKQDILENFLSAHDCNWENADNTFIKSVFSRHKISDQLFKKDLLYHILDKGKSLYYLREEAGEIDKILKKEEIVKFIKNPPEDTRAYFRGKCMERFCPQIEDINWSRISFRKKELKRGADFDIESGAFSQIFLLNPAWGKRDDVKEFFEKDYSFEKILEELTGKTGGK
jgi:hypothetical protein